MKRSKISILALLLLLCAAIICYKLIPPLQHPRHETNDWYIPGKIKTILGGQQEFKDACIIDIDKDGVGQYGTLDELSLENQSRFKVAMKKDCPFIPSSPFWKPNKAGVVSVGGYCIKLILPSEITKLDGNDEISFLIYAWPTIVGKTGKQLLVANQSGTIYCLQPSPFSGPSEIPNWDYASVTMKRGTFEIDSQVLQSTGWKMRE